MAHLLRGYRAVLPQTRCRFCCWGSPAKTGKPRVSAGFPMVLPTSRRIFAADFLQMQQSGPTAGWGGLSSADARQRMTGSNGNAVDYFLDRHLREGRGERLAFVDPWRRLTYTGLADASARFAAGLRAAGIEREQRIALVMLDTTDFPIAFWGALRAGI